MARPRKTESRRSSSYLDKIESDIRSNQSTLSLVLGALIVLVVGVLVLNYFNKSKTEVGPAQQTSKEQPGDVSAENLPGKYTVKKGDTLYLIAEKYYKDGFKYDEIAKANNLSDVNTIEVGKVLEIPKLRGAVAQASPTTEPTSVPTEAPVAVTSPIPQPTQVAQGQNEPPAFGGADTTIWGPRIEGGTYTIVEGDWLSTISARAYGDIYAYQKIAQANNIANPDLILPGQVLKIPR